MKLQNLHYLCCLPALLLLACETTANGDDVLDARVAKILATNCGACHRDSDEGGLNYITNLSKMIERKKVTPGNPAASRVWVRINDASDPMPPAGEMPRPSAEDIKTIEAWIKSLSVAPQPAQPPKPETPQPTVETKRSSVSTADVINSIHDYLAGFDAADRRFQRFIVLNHLHNMPTRQEDKDRGYDQEQLDAVRAAVSKTLNSLSWVPNIVLPKIIDANKTVMAFDLRDVQWNENRRVGQPDLWSILLQEYPYALTHDQYPDLPNSQRKAREIYDWTGVNFPWIRADWFVATATQPHFYHALVYDAVIPEIRHREPHEVEHADAKKRTEQPMTVDDLLELLKVDLLGNIRRGRAARAGFTRSGVSSQPRLLERVSAIYGYLWGSYDFKRGNLTMNLNARPLGPDGTLDAKFSKFSFQHDGGEMIFGLPNGLHGYFLATSQGTRLPFGPVDIVEDRAKTLGNGIIVNGLSCIACHKQGLIEEFRDEIRFGIKTLPAEARQVARKLYLDRPELDDLIKQDQSRYRRALIAAIGPFVSAESQKTMEDGGALIEPIGPVARRFLVDTLDLTTIARELEVDPARLKNAVQFDGVLQRLGLGGIAEGSTTNREIWQSGKGLSVFQQAAQSLKVGSPGSFEAPPWRNR